MATLTKKQAIALAEKYESMPQLTPLILPIPTSKNNLRKVIRRGGYTSQTFTKEYKQFKKETLVAFKWWQMENEIFEPLKGQRSKLILGIQYEVIEANHKHDLANRSEALLDALKGLAWEDDAYINLTRHIPSDPSATADKENPRAIVYLNPYQISCV